MTTRTLPHITLESPTTTAADTATTELEQLEGQLQAVQTAALNGTIAASSYANLRDEVEIARLRANLAQAAAAEERANLPTDATIAATVDELLTDPALDITPVLDAFTALQAALDTIRTVTAARDEAISGWVNRLRDLGIPDRGLHIDDDELTVYTGAGSATVISLGTARISGTGKIAPYIGHVVHPHIRGTDMRIDPASLARTDRRNREGNTRIRVRLTQNLGGKKPGDEITSATHSASVLARLVDGGQAELIDGELPALPEPKTRTYLPVGSDTTPIEGARTATQQAQDARDTAAVDAAVKAAFTS